MWRTLTASRRSTGRALGRRGSLRTIFLVASVLLSMLRTWAADPPPAAPLATDGGSSLRETYDRLFTIGVALDGYLPDDYNASELALIRTQFAALTPANCMKMTHLQPEPGRFDFRMADALVAFAATNQLKVCGHCLVWAKDERTPEWVFRDGEKPASRELLLERMQTHIKAVAGRYRGKVISWDVVNEALDDGTNFIRPSKWFSTLGEEFIVKAFEYARQADPEAVLIYNDYNVEWPAKRAKLLRLLRLLQEQQAPIQAVGIQGHYELDTVPYQDLEETISAIHSLGLKVMMTEFDLDAIPRARWWADGGKHRQELARLESLCRGLPDRRAATAGRAIREALPHFSPAHQCHNARHLLGPARRAQLAESFSVGASQLPPPL